MEKLLCVLGLLSAEPQAEITLFKLSRKVIEKQTSVSSWCLFKLWLGFHWGEKNLLFVGGFFLFPNGKKNPVFQTSTGQKTLVGCG